MNRDPLIFKFKYLNHTSDFYVNVAAIECHGAAYLEECLKQEYNKWVSSLIEPDITLVNSSKYPQISEQLDSIKNNESITFKFNTEFTDMPSGIDTGPYCAKIFRYTHLIPMLKSYNIVTLDLSNVYGFGSSFLMHAFAGLNKEFPDLSKHLIIKCDDDPMTVKQINYILYGDTKCI